MDLATQLAKPLPEYTIQKPEKHSKESKQEISKIKQPNQVKLWDGFIESVRSFKLDSKLNIQASSTFTFAQNRVLKFKEVVNATIQQNVFDNLSVSGIITHHYNYNNHADSKEQFKSSSLVTLSDSDDADILGEPDFLF